MKTTDKLFPGVTLRSLAVSVLSLVILAVLIQFVSISDSWLHTFGSEPLAVPAVQILVVLAGIVGLFKGLRRFTILTRAELLCVFFSLLIAAPIMATGFWQRAVASMARTAKDGVFERQEVMKDELWPHGDNVLAGKVLPGSQVLTSLGNVTWEDVQILSGREITVPRFTNTLSNETSCLRIAVPVRGPKGHLNVYPGQPYYLAMLVRARNLGGQSHYYCRVYPDTLTSLAREVFVARTQEKKTYINRYGFVPLGAYGVELPRRAVDSVVVEVGLSGAGIAEFADMRLMDVTAIEYVYRGKRTVSKTEYAQLSEVEKIGILCRPESALSIEALKFYLGAGIPYGDWLPPLSRWMLIVFLLITAMFAVAAIMRRQWIQNERYPLPLAQIPFAILGEKQADNEDASSIWSERILWVGMVLSLLWCMSTVWHNWNLSAPNLRVNIPLKSYFADAAWGKTWNGINFDLMPLFFALGLFMELNVLMSLVVGFLLFRLQYWFGEANGFAADVKFPYEKDQLLGAYAAYGVLTLVFTRKYLWATLKKAILGERSNGEVLSYRAAYLLLLASFGGAFFWAKWVGITTSGVMIPFVVMVMTGLVAMKFRAECGTPYNQFISIELFRFLPIVGGAAVLGADGMLFGCTLLLFTGIAFFNIPGIQLEMIEAGKRYNVRRSHIIVAALIGVLGAFTIGGWVYLSNTYGYGADNYFRSSGLFGTQVWGYESFGTEMTAATEKMLKGDGVGSSPSGGPGAALVSFCFGIIVTTMLTVVRQLFAGFWFHPVGFILGSTEMMKAAWGSLLLAWLVRFAVLRFGGAVTVRTKLKPFAVGVFMGAMAAYAAVTIINGYIFFFNNGAKEFRNFF